MMYSPLEQNFAKQKLVPKAECDALERFNSCVLKFHMIYPELPLKSTLNGCWVLGLEQKYIKLLYSLK